ncbi:unnamed protein product, partial [marine sediment metagenome]
AFSGTRAIGAKSGGSDSSNGTIDEVMIFSRSLSAAEIAALYNASKNQSYHNYTSLSDATHNFTGYAVDRAGNVNSTPERSVTVDATEPSFSANKTNGTATTPRYNGVVQINLTLSDSVGLDGYFFAHNDTSTMANGSYRDVSGTSHTVIENITVNTLTRGDILGWQVWVNDTLGNVNVSQVYTLEIKNTAPDQPNIIYPEEGKNYSSINNINYSSGDVDGDSLNYDIYINGSFNTTLVDVNLSEWNASDGYYNLTVTA